MSYSALLIDVIESRRYADRLLVQELLKRIIGYLNEVFRPGLVYYPNSKYGFVC
ncbi:MAG: hypothetical protein QM208_01745 [Bacillota bacterium]|jgi:hypothetical protein|nr:hypothetical protein [Bacillota bacterium]NLM32490.1 hypothetical protein [Acholeplasmataceae bacterium]